MENVTQEVYLKVFFDWTERFQRLSNEEFGQLIRAAIAYKQTGDVSDMEGRVALLFDVIRPDLDRDTARSKEASARHRMAGQKGAQSRWGKKDAEEDSQAMEKDDKDSKAMLCQEDDGIEEEKEEEEEQEEEKEQEQEEEKEEEKEKESIPSAEGVCISSEAGTHIPTREEIKAFCEERKNGIDGDYFFDYYAATGWRVGQNPIRDWRALVRAWEQRDKQQGQSPRPPTGPGRPGPLADAVQNVLDVAQAKHRARQRNTLLNYREEPSHVQLEDISFDLDEL